MYGIRYTQSVKRLMGTDTRLQALIDGVLPRWEKLTHALGALDERLQQFIDSKPAPLQAQADMPSASKDTDAGISFYPQEDLEEEGGEGEGGSGAPLREDEGGSPPSASPAGRRPLPDGIRGASAAATFQGPAPPPSPPPAGIGRPPSSPCFGGAGDLIKTMVYDEVEFVFGEAAVDEIEPDELVDGLNEKTPICFEGQAILENDGFTASNVRWALRELSEEGKVELDTNGKIKKV